MISRSYVLTLALFCLAGCGVSSGRAPYNGKTLNYTVVRGDTLAEIANRHESSIPQLVELNDIDDPDILEAGQTLIIPATYTAKRNLSQSGRAISGGAHEFQEGQLKWPVEGGHLISEFGPRGDHGFHDGLDIGAKEGTNVYAAHDGVVIYSDNELGGFGELIIIKSSTSLITLYAHNSKRLVTVGQKVTKGMEIARIGQTGRAKGPHLHFEVRVKDRAGQYAAVDPAPLLKSKEKPSLRYRINQSLAPLLAKLNIWDK